MKQLFNLCIMVLLIHTSYAQTKTTPKLPFIGKRYFVTDQGMTGMGTPHYSIEIKQNGDVYFRLEQENQATGGLTVEKAYAGKYKPYLTCYFKDSDERHYYKIVGNTIYELDEKKNVICTSSCCETYDSNNPDKQCECKGTFSKSIK